MRIGVDGISFAVPRMTGIKRYLLELCRRLADNGADLKIYNFYPLPPEQQEILAECSFVCHQAYAPGEGQAYLPTYRLKPWWLSALPRLMRGDQLDVFWGPGAGLPYALPIGMARAMSVHHLYPPLLSRADESLLSSRLFHGMRLRHGLRHADRVITVSRATQSDLIARYRHRPWWDERKLAYIPCAGREMSSHNAMTAAQILSIDRPYILFVGQVFPRKNVPRLLAAWGQLEAELRQRVALVIAGSDRGRPLLPLVESMNLQGTVHLCGEVEDDVLDALYRDCLFLALPSLKEGFGIPLVEAMGYGKAVLTANNSSMPEVAGSAGYLVDAEDVNSIAVGLRRLITEVPLRQSLEGYAKAQAARYSWDQAARDMISLFEQAVAARAMVQHGKA